MARYTGAVCRLCRREGQKLFLKGERCYSEKCAFAKRAYAPGQHGNGRNKKLSEYGTQLRAKQKARRYYGVLEGQFYHYYEIATTQAGVAGENLLRLCESRMDNLVYRMGFATSRAEARVLVGQEHFTLNGRKMNIPSAQIKVGDEIAVAEKSKQSPKFKAIAEINGGRPVPTWLEASVDTFKGKVLRVPAREDIDFEVEEHLIVEGYSK